MGLQARETIARQATAAPTAPPQALLDPENWPPMLDDADAPDLESILDSVYRTAQCEAPPAELSSRAAALAEPPAAEAGQSFALVVVDPPAQPRVKVRRRRKRRTPLVQRVRENPVARGMIYGIWAIALIALVLTLLQLAR